MAVRPSRLSRAGRAVRRLLHDRRGVTAIEYGLILAFVFLVIFVAVVQLGNVTSLMWNDISTEVDKAS